MSADLKGLGRVRGVERIYKSALRKRLWGLTHSPESPRIVRYVGRTKQAIAKHAECHIRGAFQQLGGLVVHQYLAGGSHLQPLPGCCLIMLPLHHPCVMEIEQVLPFGAKLFVPHGVHAVAFNLGLCVGKSTYHWLCGFMIVISSLVLVAWVCLAIGIACLAF